MDINLARRLHESGRLGEAEKMFRELANDPLQRTEALYRLGLMNFQKGNLEAASDYFTSVLKVDRKAHGSMYYLAEIALIRHDQISAIRLFASALAINPRNLAALNRLASLAPPAARVNQPTPTVIPPINRREADDAIVRPSKPPIGRPPRPSSSPDSTVGIARKVKLQAVPFNGQPNGKQLLTFRVDVINKNGVHVNTIDVEMRNFNIKGRVDDGDWVEISATGSGGRLKSFMNLSTGVRVTSKMWM